MRLYLIRHGRQCSKLCNVDVDLSEEGWRQAALVGERLFPSKIDVVYSSDMVRAVQTAEAANLYWNVEHIIRPELREICFGELEGMSDEAIEEKYGYVKREMDRMEQDVPYPGGECAADVAARALPALKKIAVSGSKNAAVVTHGGVIRSVLACILGMNPAKSRLIGNGIENGSITELLYEPEKDRFTLLRLNDYAHLEKYPELLRESWID